MSALTWQNYCTAGADNSSAQSQGFRFLGHGTTGHLPPTWSVRATALSIVRAGLRAGAPAAPGPARVLIPTSTHGELRFEVLIHITLWNVFGEKVWATPRTSAQHELLRRSSGHSDRRVT